MNTTRNHRLGLGPLMALSITLAMLAVTWAPAQEPRGESADKPAESELMILNVRHSEVLSAPWPIKRISVSDPEIADVQMLTPRSVLVLGKSVGTTDLIMWSEQEEAWRTKVEVQVDPDNAYAVQVVTPASQFYMYDALKLFFDNGGGNCRQAHHPGPR